MIIFLVSSRQPCLGAKVVDNHPSPPLAAAKNCTSGARGKIVTAAAAGGKCTIEMPEGVVARYSVARR